MTTTAIPFRQLEDAIINALAGGPKTVGELVEATGHMPAVVEAALRELRVDAMVQAARGADGRARWERT